VTVVLAVSWYASPQVQAVFAYVGVWFLLFGGLRPVAELQSMRRGGRLRQSDADQLAWVTGVPGLVWVGFFGLATVLVLLVGAASLLGAYLPQVSLPH
jgi:Peptidase M50B-like